MKRKIDVFNYSGEVDLICTIERVSTEAFEIHRKSHRGDMVNLGTQFNGGQVQKIARWAGSRTKLPTWEQWKKFLRTVRVAHAGV